MSAKSVGLHLIAGTVYWAGLTATRLRAAAEQNLCQVRGQTLGEKIWFVLVGGDIAAGGPLHERCKDLAAVVCPVLARQAVAFIETSREALLQGAAALLGRLCELEDAHGVLPRTLSISA